MVQSAQAANKYLLSGVKVNLEQVSWDGYCRERVIVRMLNTCTHCYVRFYRASKPEDNISCTLAEVGCRGEAKVALIQGGHHSRLIKVKNVDGIEAESIHKMLFMQYDVSAVVNLPLTSDGQHSAHSHVRAFVVGGH